MRYLILAALLSLAACSSAEEKLCRAQIGDGLLNPETADYSDFTALNADAADEGALSYLKGYLDRAIPDKSRTYHRIKVRAEGRLGNKITSFQLCAVDAAKSKCACIAEPS